MRFAVKIQYGEIDQGYDSTTSQLGGSLLPSPKKVGIARIPAWLTGEKYYPDLHGDVAMERCVCNAVILRTMYGQAKPS